MMNRSGESIGPLSHSVVYKGKLVKSSKRQFTWEFQHIDHKHTIVLELSSISRKYRIRCDDNKNTEGKYKMFTNFQTNFTCCEMNVGLVQGSDDVAFFIDGAEVHKDLFLKAQDRVQMTESFESNQVGVNGPEDSNFSSMPIEEDSKGGGMKVDAKNYSAPLQATDWDFRKTPHTTSDERFGQATGLKNNLAGIRLQSNLEFQNKKPTSSSLTNENTGDSSNTFLSPNKFAKQLNAIQTKNYELSPRHGSDQTDNWFEYPPRPQVTAPQPQSRQVIDVTFLPKYQSRVLSEYEVRVEQYPQIELTSNGNDLSSITQLLYSKTPIK